MTTETRPPSRTECAAILARESGDYGFVPILCTQRVGVRTFVTTTGLRVGYCTREGHEARVRRLFAERVRLTGWEPLPDESEAEKAAEWYQRGSL